MSRRTAGTSHANTAPMGWPAPHTIVVTGGTRGIGRAAVGYIARHDPQAHVLLLARRDTGRAVAAQLSAAGHTASSIEADLASPASTRQAADQIARRLDSGELPPLRGILGNAGRQFTNDVTENPDGLEATFAINVLANHVLLSRLHDRLGTPGRIVITVSDTHFGDFRHNMGVVPGPAWQDPARLARTSAFPNPAGAAAGRTAYSTSKLAAIYLVHEYARRLADGIHIVGYNPGFVPGTGLARDTGALERFVTRRIMPLLTLTPLATGQKAAGRRLAHVLLGHTQARTGGYVDRTRTARSSDESYDEDRERRLWDTLEELTRAVAVPGNAQ